MPSSETLLAYARIFEMPKRDPVSRRLNPPSEIELAAAHALRLQARALARAIRQSAYPPEGSPEQAKMAKRDEDLVRLFDEGAADA